MSLALGGPSLLLHFPPGGTQSQRSGRASDASVPSSPLVPGSTAGLERDLTSSHHAGGWPPAVGHLPDWGQAALGTSLSCSWRCSRPSGWTCCSFVPAVWSWGGACAKHLWPRAMHEATRRCVNINCHISFSFKMAGSDDTCRWNLYLIYVEKIFIS